MGKKQQLPFEAPPEKSLLSHNLLDISNSVLDGLEKARIANENRLRHLLRTEPDDDGILRGLGLEESHPTVKTVQAIVEALRGAEHVAELNLKRVVRTHPLHDAWITQLRGVGEKTAARLLAVTGDPYIRPEMKSEDGQVIEPSRPRTVATLWAYCGLHTVDGAAPKKVKGRKVNWNPKARTRAWLIAESCIKTLRAPCKREDGTVEHVEGCECSPFRVAYDKRRAYTAVTHLDWTPAKSHGDAQRIAMKEIVKHLWITARDMHKAVEADEKTGTGPSTPGG